MENSNEISSPETNTPEATQVQTDVIRQPVGDTPKQPLSEPTLPQKTGKKWLVPVLISLVIITLGVAGYFIYQNFQLRKEQPVLDQSTPTPASEVPSPTPDPTSDWETYSDNGYAFKYPKGLKSDTGAAGQGIESIRVQFMGPKQVASGRTETSLFDGYSFVVTKISSNTSKTAQQQAQEERANSEENCGFDQSTITPITQTQIAGISASQYSITECFGDYTSSYLVNDGNLYGITQLYTGEEPEKQDYKAITNQILSTFKFISQADTTSNKDIVNLEYTLKPGWVSISNPSNSLQVGYNPETMQATSNNSSVSITTTSQFEPIRQITYANIHLRTYDGGSSHNFIYEQLSSTADAMKQDRMENYYEVEYDYDGKSCLVLYNQGFSASGTTWGMCAISSTQAVFIEGPQSQNQTEEIIRTIKVQ